jgi:hypothetical protein
MDPTGLVAFSSLKNLLLSFVKSMEVSQSDFISETFIDMTESMSEINE